MTIKQYQEYQVKINQAKTNEEIKSILYSAFLQDGNALYGNNTLYNKVVKMCLKRTTELEKDFPA